MIRILDILSIIEILLIKINTMKLISLIQLVIILSFTIVFNSCGDDEIKGCTDVNADNYNAEATVSGDCNYTGCTDPDAENYDPNANISGDCVYARDKFLGSFSGSLSCPGELESLTNDDLSFSIIEGLDPDIKSDIILQIVVDGIDLAIAGTVDGESLILEQELKGVTVPTTIGPVMGDVDATGMAMMSNNDMTLDGTLDLQVAVAGGFLNLADNCIIVGEKQ